MRTPFVLGVARAVSLGIGSRRVQRAMRYLPSLPKKHKAVVFGGLVLLALLAVSAIFGRHGVLHLRRLHAEQERVERFAAQLGSENLHLREHLRRLQHDDAYLEKLARERLGWIKPGETLYHVAPARRRGAASDPVPAPDDP
jgi:cell division protein FtsB